MTSSGAGAAPETAGHSNSGPGRARDAPPYSYASTISSARAGARVPSNLNVAVPTAFQPYDDRSTAGTDDGWTSTSASASASVSGSMNASETLFSFPFSSYNISQSPQLLLPQYDPEAENQGSYATPLETAFHAQRAQLDALSDFRWGADTGTEDAGDPGGTAGFSFRPASGGPRPDSYVGDTAGSLEMSRLDMNPHGGARFAEYAAELDSSAPVSPVASRDKHSQDWKRVKVEKSQTAGPARELRSASRTSKNTGKAAETSEQLRTRSSHNMVEKQYRNRLNAQFEELLATLPMASPGETSPEDEEGDGAVRDRRLKMGDKRRFSKGEVLDMARQRILYLEEENRKIEREIEDLKKKDATGGS